MDIFALAQINKLKKNGGVGYDELATVELIPEASYEFDHGRLVYPISNACDSASKIVTTIDGTKYESVPKSIFVGGVPAIIAGNGVAYGFPDTGEPYLVVIGEAEGTLIAMVVFLADMESEETTQHTVSVVANVATIHPIDLKYISAPVFRFEDFGLTEPPLKTIVFLNPATWSAMVKLLSTPGAVVCIPHTDSIDGLDITRTMYCPVIAVTDSASSDGDRTLSAIVGCVKDAKLHYKLYRLGYVTATNAFGIDVNEYRIEATDADQP